MANRKIMNPNGIQKDVEAREREREMEEKSYIVQPDSLHLQDQFIYFWGKYMSISTPVFYSMLN